MRRNIFFPRNVQALSSALGIVTIVILWILFAPTQVGGLASYVIVIGSSMEPRFHIGDLIIAHREPLYKVDDAVVYRNTEMQGFVFHRIIAAEQGRFTLQGDNNSWVDTYQPTREEVIGKLWVHIPRGGIVMQKIRNPWVMALIAAVFGTIFMTSLFGNKTKGNTSMNNKSLRDRTNTVKQKVRDWFVQIDHPEPPKSSAFDLSTMTEGSFFTFGLVLLSSLIVGIISFSRPTSRAVSNDIQYQHLSIFSYMASAPQGVYDSNAIKSGDPIFPRLTCVVDVNLQYALIAQEAEYIAGTYQLSAVIREQVSGWQREVPLQEETSFSGNSFGTSAKLDLCKFDSLTQSMERETDFHPGSYTLTVKPNIKINGELSGRALDSTFNTGLRFLHDRVHFYLPQDGETERSLSFTEVGTINVLRNEANTVVFLGKQIPVPAMRWSAMTGLIISLAGFVYLGLKLQALANTDPAQFLRMKHGSLIVDVSQMDPVGAGRHIDVTSMDAMAKLAERFNTIILHVQNCDSDQYLVQAGGVTYQFRLRSDRPENAIPAFETPNSGGEA